MRRLDLFQLGFLLKTAFKTFWSWQTSEQWLGPPVTYGADRPPKTRLLLLYLSSTIVEGISLRCYKENTSITALLTMLIARQLACAYPTYSEFPASIAVSASRFKV